MAETTRPEHWVFVVGWLTMGGAERQALRFARLLHEQWGCKITFVGLANHGPVEEECARNGFECIYWPAGLEGSLVSRLKTLARFLRLMRRLKPTHIAPYTMVPNLICGIAWRLSGACACVWQQRDEGRFRYPGVLERLALSFTPAYISNSEHARNWLVENLGVRPSATTVIQNGIEIFELPAGMRTSGRAKFKLKDDDFVAVMVANIHRWKDHATLVRAWKIVVDRAGGPRRPILVLAGYHADSYETIRDLIASEGLTEHVLCPGVVKEVPGLLGAADLIAFSSKTEGCPNGVLEGMAAGLPVAATDIPAIREAVGDDGAPFLAPPDNSAALAEKILKFYHDPVLGENIGRLNRKRIEREFSPEKMTRETRAVFEKVAAGTC